MGASSSRAAVRTLDKATARTTISQHIEPAAASLAQSAEVTPRDLTPPQTTSSPPSALQPQQPQDQLPLEVLEEKNAALDDMLLRLGGSLRERTLPQTLADMGMGVSYEQQIKAARDVWKAKADQRRKGRLEPRELVEILESLSRSTQPTSTIDFYAKKHSVDPVLVQQAASYFAIPPTPKFRK